MKTALFTILLLLPMVARAYDFSVVNSDGITIYYSYAEGGVSVVQGEEKYKGNVKIPSSVEFNGTQYNVTAIAENGMAVCPDLISVEIPESVLSIGTKAFYSNWQMTTVKMGNQVMYIGGSCFEGCRNISSINLS